jgi:hypothetical protein
MLRVASGRMAASLQSLRDDAGAGGERHVFLGRPRLDGLLRKAEWSRRLEPPEARKLVRGIYAGKFLGPRSVGRVKSILRQTRVLDRQSQQLVAEFVALPYFGYVQRALRARAAARIAYRKDHIPTATAHDRRPGTAMTAKYLTIHSTANEKSFAKGERSWLTNTANPRQASFHVVVDQSEAVECVPLDEVAWHAGDGGGSGNMQSISLEICESGDRETTLRNAASVAAKILMDNKLALSSLRRHHDWSTKICPRILIDASFRKSPTQTWEWFKDEIDVLLD